MDEQKDFDAVAFNEWVVGVIEGDKEATDWNVSKQDQCVYFWYTDDLEELPETAYYSEWK